MMKGGHIAKKIHRLALDQVDRHHWRKEGPLLTDLKRSQTTDSLTPS